MKHASKIALARKFLFPILTAAISLPITSSLFAKETMEKSIHKSLKEVKEEAEALGKSLKPSIAQIFEKPLVTEDDLLPDEDKGKRFDSKAPMLCPFEKQILKALDTGKRAEPIDEAEPFLRQSQKIIQAPEQQIGVQKLERDNPSRQRIIETCEEGILRVIPVEQFRKIEVIPEKTEIHFICQGHEKKKRFFWESEAKRQKEKWEKELFSDQSLAYQYTDIEVGGLFSDYIVVKRWSHRDGVACDHSRQETLVTREYQEETSWETSNLDTLHYLENSSHCHLKGTSYPCEDKRLLIFQCDSGESAPCKRIRDRGGLLIDKKCIANDPEGECTIYLKTFEIIQKEISQNPYTFNDTEIFGLNAFDTISEVDPDFGEAISKLTAISEIPGNTEGNADLLKAEVFSGKIETCKRSFNGTILYDCCGDCRGFALDLHLAGCTEDEKELYKKRREGKCHYIGTRSLKMGLEKENVYVCFPTVLSRIIQEDGRKQLNISWGEVDSPRPEGLKMDQIKQINFDAVDFSDFIVKLKANIDQAAIADKIKNTVNSFNENQAKTQTENLLRGEKERCGG